MTHRSFPSFATIHTKTSFVSKEFQFEFHSENCRDASSPALDLIRQFSWSTRVRFTLDVAWNFINTWLHQKINRMQSTTFKTLVCGQTIRASPIMLHEFLVPCLASGMQLLLSHKLFTSLPIIDCALSSSIDRKCVRRRRKGHFSISGAFKIT